jgi:hypothetical protein
MSEMKDSQDRKEPDEVCCIYKAEKVLDDMYQNLASSPDSHIMEMALEVPPQVGSYHSLLDQLTHFTDFLTDPVIIIDGICVCTTLQVEFPY